MTSTSKPRPLDVSEQDVALGLSLDVNERTLKALVMDAPGLLHTSDADRERSNSRIQVRLSALDTLFTRLDTVAQSTCPAEVERYGQELQDLAQEQEEIEAEIKVLRRDLEQAQKERAHKLEYDALAKDIVKYPPRDETEVAIERLRHSLETLKHERQGYRTIAESIKEQYEDATAIFEKMGTYISDQIATREREAVQTGVDRDDNDNEDELDQQRDGPSGTRREEGLTPANDDEVEGGETCYPRDSPGARPGFEESEEEGEEPEEGAAFDPPALPSTTHSRAETPPTASLNPSAPAFKPSVQARLNVPPPQGSRAYKRGRTDGANEPAAYPADSQYKRRR